MENQPDYITLLREYFRSGTYLTVPKARPIVSLEDRTQFMHYLSSGYVRIYSENGRGEQYTHILYGPGDIFPLTWISKHRQTYATYETLTEAEIFSQPITAFTKDLIDVPGLAYGMLQQAIEQYRIYALRVENLEYKYASERIAYRLVVLGNRFGERSGKNITIIPPMTHLLLASSLNLSRESVSREMQKLIRKSIIRTNSAHQIIIMNMSELADQAHIPSRQGLS